MKKINENTEKKYIDIIKQNSYRLLRLVNNIIDLTKIDSDFFDIQLKNLNVVEVVENTVLSVAEYIKSNGIKITFDTDVEEKIMAIDIDQFERIILNLISNAIKFAKPEGNIWVSLYDKQDHLIISVKDDGKGIPKDKLPIIFERFYQIDKSLSRECEGSGVGLAIVKSLVEKHGGKITVNSTLGVGSEFTMKFPIRTIPEKIPTSSSTLLNENQDCMEKVNIEFSDIYSI
ncbi:histidine kinase [Clostridium carboxidivorans P7]|uniref:histidine kinase n=1 Tax=Clostridium carboxidivorans P7 TaxID=536227 RepID=C6PVJ8_9CLOT|nr:HAMP domain-containing sensor histidine kinase [Clostridium carboxidivorans]EET86763.1 histidine kinase [Clostridium carboxidivorans P7]